jgi:hypothetical protein
MADLKLAHPITPVDVEVALSDVEAGCGTETANLLRDVSVPGDEV